MERSDRVRDVTVCGSKNCDRARSGRGYQCRCWLDLARRCEASITAWALQVQIGAFYGDGDWRREVGHSALAAHQN